MTRSLADALVPPELRDLGRPPRPRKPYVSAGADIACANGHRIGRLDSDIPRVGAATPETRLYILDVPPEQRLLVPNAETYGGQPDEFIDLDQIVYIACLAHEGTDPHAWATIWKGFWERGFTGKCRVCGEPWLKLTFKRDRSIRGFRIRTSRGWNDKPPKRRQGP